MEPRHYGLQLRRFIGENTEHCIPEMYEYIQDQVMQRIKNAVSRSESLFER